MDRAMRQITVCFAGDAPARFLRDAAVAAEELGYDSLLLAVYREEP